MKNESDLRLKEQKRKIFAEQLNQNKSMKPMTASNSLSALLSSQLQQSSHTSKDDLSHKVEELKIKNNQLKILLKEERERYDSLFEEYQELMEKNSLMEKQYISLKYQHNRQVKELKKNLVQSIDYQVEQCIQQFYQGVRRQDIEGPIMVKLVAMNEKLRAISQIITSIKLPKHHSKRSLLHDSRQNSNHSTISDHHFAEEKDMVDIRDIQILPELQKEPELLQQKQQPIVVAQSALELPIANSQKEWEDEYYGSISDFQQFQEKVKSRRNYQLMRRNIRSSTDVRRKKIFNSMAQQKCL